jgi:hypothetical protein
MNPRARLIEFLAWRGWSKAALAAAIDVDPSTVTKVALGQRGAGLELAVGIERVTAEPRDDGETWPDGPIRVAEWVRDDEHAQSVTPAASAVESAS